MEKFSQGFPEDYLTIVRHFPEICEDWLRTLYSQNDKTSKSNNNLQRWMTHFLCETDPRFQITEDWAGFVGICHSHLEQQAWKVHSVRKHEKKPGTWVTIALKRSHIWMLSSFNYNKRKNVKSSFFSMKQQGVSVLVLPPGLDGMLVHHTIPNMKLPMPLGLDASSSHDTQHEATNAPWIGCLSITGYPAWSDKE